MLVKRKNSQLNKMLETTFKLNFRKHFNRAMASANTGMYSAFQFPWGKKSILSRKMRVTPNKLECSTIAGKEGALKAFPQKFPVSQCQQERNGQYHMPNEQVKRKQLCFLWSFQPLECPESVPVNNTRVTL